MKILNFIALLLILNSFAEALKSQPQQKLLCFYELNWSEMDSALLAKKKIRKIKIEKRRESAELPIIRVGTMAENVIYSRWELDEKGRLMEQLDTEREGMTWEEAGDDFAERTLFHYNKNGDLVQEVRTRKGRLWELELLESYILELGDDVKLGIDLSRIQRSYKKGKKATETIEELDGNVSQCKWDVSGRLINKTVSWDDQSTSWAYDYQNSKHTECCVICPDSERLCDTVWREYNTKGQLSGKKTKELLGTDPKIRTLWLERCKHDAQNRLVDCFIQKDGKKSFELKILYAEDRVLRMDCYDDFDDKFKSINYTYNKDGLLIKKELLIGEQQTVWIINYN